MVLGVVVTPIIFYDNIINYYDGLNNSLEVKCIYFVHIHMKDH